MWYSCSTAAFTPWSVLHALESFCSALLCLTFWSKDQEIVSITLHLSFLDHSTFVSGPRILFPNDVSLLLGPGQLFLPWACPSKNQLFYWHAPLFGLSFFTFGDRGGGQSVNMWIEVCSSPVAEWNWAGREREQWDHLTRLLCTQRKCQESKHLLWPCLPSVWEGIFVTVSTRTYLRVC